LHFYSKQGKTLNQSHYWLAGKIDAAQKKELAPYGSQLLEAATQ
jgi:hypothetical protein